jgi:hypothetical protein
MSSESAKPKCDIVYDESGRLVSDVFFEFGVQFNEYVIQNERDASWIVVSREESDDASTVRWLGTEVLHEGLPKDWQRYRHDCPVSKQHKTQLLINTKTMYADLCGDSEVSAFLPNSTGDEVVVSDEFMGRLQKTGLTGMRFFPLRINVNQSGTEKTGNPKLFVLELTGRIWERSRKVLGKPNACPFCSFGPLLCSACGDFYPDCPKCGKHTMMLWIAHPGGKDKQLASDDVPAKGRILRGETWDGADFVQANDRKFLTKRALDWLLCVHAKPMYVRPTQVLVDGMSVEQKQWLKRAKKSLN